MTTPDQTADRTRDVADVLLDDVWDAATNAVCQTMQESRMCNCPDGQCLAATVRPERADYARLAEEIETLWREHDRQKRRGDNHWETLRSIREIAREGDCARIIQWVNDAGSGYVQSAEVTLKEMTDRAIAAEAALATAQAENARLREALAKARDIYWQDDESDIAEAMFMVCHAALSADMPAGGGEPVAVQIKPLEWEWRKEGFWRAATACDWGYRVYRKGDGWEFNNWYFDAPEAAKAAAQADYEQRIRSALITPPSPAPDRHDGCPCHGCGARYSADLIVPDDVWAKIVKDGEELLCARCIMERIASAGIWTAGRTADVGASAEPVAYEHIKLPGTFRTPEEYAQAVPAARANYRPLYASPPSTAPHLGVREG